MMMPFSSSFLFGPPSPSSSPLAIYYFSKGKNTVSKGKRKEKGAK